MKEWLSDLTEAAKIGFVFSVCWLLVVFVIAVDEADGYQGFEVPNFLSTFIVYGVVPVALGWGVRWVRRSSQGARPTNKPVEQSDQVGPYIPNESIDSLGFSWWNVWAWLGLIAGNLFIAAILLQEMQGLALSLIAINSVMMIMILNYNKYAFLVATIVSLNPILWMVNGIYLKNRWSHPRVNGRR